MATVKASTKSGQEVAASLQDTRRAARERCVSMMALGNLTADQWIRHYQMFITFRDIFMKESMNTAARNYVNNVEAVLVDPASYPLNANRAFHDGIETWNYLDAISGDLDMHDVRVVSYEFIVAMTNMIDAMHSVNVSTATTAPTKSGEDYVKTKFSTSSLEVAAQGIYSAIEV